MIGKRNLLSRYDSHSVRTAQLTSGCQWFKQSGKHVAEWDARRPWEIGHSCIARVEEAIVSKLSKPAGYTEPEAVQIKCEDFPSDHDGTCPETGCKGEWNHHSLEAVHYAARVHQGKEIDRHAAATEGDDTRFEYPIASN